MPGYINNQALTVGMIIKTEQSTHFLSCKHLRASEQVRPCAMPCCRMHATALLGGESHYQNAVSGMKEDIFLRHRYGV
jgi:hypothetical protein